MAKKGYIIESQIAAKDVDAFNRNAIASDDVDGGALVALGGLATGDNNLFEATLATDGTGGGLYMAYNPSEHFTKVGDNIFAGLTVDPRDYTNLANRPFDVFKPQIGDVIAFTDGNIKTGETVTKGSYLEIGASGLEVQVSPTANTTSFKVIEVGVQPFPQAGIGHENAPKYVCEVVFN